TNRNERMKPGGKSIMRTTFMTNENNIERKWLVVDAEGERHSRKASKVAAIIREMHKPTYTPHADTANKVIIINDEKTELTKNKINKKINYSHSNHISEIKKRNTDEMRTKYPKEMLKLAIRGMLTKGTLGRKMGKKLHVYKGPEHKNQAQKPEVYELRG